MVSEPQEIHSLNVECQVVIPYSFGSTEGIEPLTFALRGLHVGVHKSNESMGMGIDLMILTEMQDDAGDSGCHHANDNSRVKPYKRY